MYMNLKTPTPSEDPYRCELTPNSSKRSSAGTTSTKSRKKLRDSVARTAVPLSENPSPAADDLGKSKRFEVMTDSRSSKQSFHTVKAWDKDRRSRKKRSI